MSESFMVKIHSNEDEEVDIKEEKLEDDFAELDSSSFEEISDFSDYEDENKSAKSDLETSKNDFVEKPKNEFEKSDEKCPKCFASFNCINSLNLHVIQDHEKVKAKVCESCQSPFRTRSQLVQHVRRVHHGGQKTLSHCPSCPTIFENAKDLRKHVQSVHEGLKPFGCDECSKRFSQKCQLIVHIKSVHQNIRPFSCDDCSETFQSKQSREIHVRTVHKHLRPFECEFCDKSFGQLPNLKSHVLRIHNESKSFECDQCKGRFGSKHDLVRHQSITHQRNFECEICRKYFGQKSVLAAHQATVHQGLRPHECRVCKVRFGTKSSLKRHSRRHLKKDVDCDEETTLLERHLKRGDTSKHKSLKKSVELVVKNDISEATLLKRHLKKNKEVESGKCVEVKSSSFNRNLKQDDFQKSLNKNSSKNSKTSDEEKDPSMLKSLDDKRKRLKKKKSLKPFAEDSYSVLTKSKTACLKRQFNKDNMKNKRLTNRNIASKCKNASDDYHNLLLKGDSFGGDSLSSSKFPLVIKQESNSSELEEHSDFQTENASNLNISARKEKQPTLSKKKKSRIPNLDRVQVQEIANCQLLETNLNHTLQMNIKPARKSINKQVETKRSNLKDILLNQVSDDLRPLTEDQISSEHPTSIELNSGATQFQEKDFDCRICLKKFSQRGNMLTHVDRIHGCSKSFECSICSSRFVRKHDLNRHTNNCHRKNFECKICFKSFGQKSVLETHVRTVHEKVQKFSCDVCGLKFGMNSSLKRHFKAKHKSELSKSLSLNLDNSSEMTKREVDYESESEFVISDQIDIKFELPEDD